MAVLYFLSVIIISIVMLAMKISATGVFSYIGMYIVFKVIPVFLIAISFLCLLAHYGYLPETWPIMAN